MPLIIIYPFLKRYTYWPQLGLGIIFNWGVLIVSIQFIGQITFNSILTGGVMTDRTIDLLKNVAKKTKKNYKNILKQAENSIPVGFISSPEQFAHFIVFLSSPLSIYINGASIPIDGGVMKSI